MKAITIKYRGKGQKICSLKADSCSGEIPSGSHTFYWIFRIKDKKDSISRIIGRVAESRLIGGKDGKENKKVYKLYGRPWLKKISEAESITLCTLDNDEYSGLPKDYIQIWGIATRGSFVNLSSREFWVIQCKNSAVLHIMNNGEKTKRGNTFEECLKKLFPNKSITINYPVYSRRVVKIEA